MSKRVLILYTAIACMMTARLVHASEQGSKAAPEVIDTLVQQPRSFGHFVGDILTQRVSLQRTGNEFEPSELPRAERVGVWFERRPARVSAVDEDGRRWLVLEYQIVNAPQEVTTIELPSLSIEDAAGARAIVVPAWPITIAPLTTAPLTQDLSQVLRGDRANPHVPTTPIWRRLIAFGTACTIAVAAWLAWLAWRNWLARRQQPFARAWAELKIQNEHAPEAWQAMHRAFDRTAGRVMQSSTLATLFQMAPHLMPQRARIERFYAQSSERFFGRGLPDDALSVRELCRDLRRLERRHER